MSRGSNLTPDMRRKVIALRKKGKTLIQISDALDIPKTTVLRTLNNYKQTKSVLEKQRSGRPRKTSDSFDRIIHRMSEKDRRKTASDISRQLSIETGTRLSRHTVSRRLVEFGLCARIARKKPFINPNNRKRRLKFAKEHRHWTAEDWAKVQFSDESKFNRVGSDGRKYVRRRKGEEFNYKCTYGTVKFGGGSVMVWGSFSQNGMGPLVKVEGNLNAENYTELLENNLLPFAKEKLPKTWIFQQDNAKCHTAKESIKFFKQNKVKILDWPASSPDLNPIKNLWDELDWRVKSQNPKNLAELWQLLQEEWKKISPQKCIDLIDSMPRRMRACIANKGFCTKYWYWAIAVINYGSSFEFYFTNIDL